MSTITPTRLPPPDYGPLQRHWGWFLGLGVVLIALGLGGLYTTFALTIASVMFFGGLVFAAGLLQLIQAFQSRRWRGFFSHVLIAVLYVVAGALMLINPLFASGVLTLFFAASLLIIGIVRMLMAFQHRGDRSWKWLLLAGIASVLLGSVIALGWPISGLWVIGLFVAVELILHGWSCIVLALGARRAARSPQHAQ